MIALSATVIREVDLPGLITYIAALAAGATLKVTLLKFPEPSFPRVYDLEAPGSCLTLSTTTITSLSPPSGASFAKSKATVEPSPVKVL